MSKGKSAKRLVKIFNCEKQQIGWRYQTTGTRTKR